MKKLLIFALVALGMLACTEKNKPEDNGNPNGRDSISGDTPVEITDGLLPGKFSLSSGKQIQFSQGNLQYQAGTNTWRFATHQYDTIGALNANISSTYDGWIDLFGWGTGNNPTLVSNDNNNYATFTDWGVNKISNGGNTANAWRTLTKDEWEYLLEKRNDGKTFGFGSVNGINGLIILPDNWENPNDHVFVYGKIAGPKGEEYEGNRFANNSFSEETWAKMDSSGAIFLPLAGVRGVSDIGTPTCSYGSSESWYWSSSPYFMPNGTEYMEAAWMIHMMKGDSYASCSQGAGTRFYGGPVRLVRDVR